MKLLLSCEADLLASGEVEVCSRNKRHWLVSAGQAQGGKVNAKHKIA